MLIPDNIDLLEKLAKINITQKNWQTAEMVAQKIATIQNPLASDLSNYLLGQIHQGQGNCIKAVELYKNILIKFPENSDTLGNMARCYERMEKRGDMINVLTDLLAKNAANISAAILLGDLYVLDKKLDKAAIVITNQIKDNPKIVQLHVSLASIKLAQNDRVGAIDVYKEGLKANPDDIKLAIALASLYQKENNYDLARSLYEQLLDKNPRLYPAINNYALLLNEHYLDSPDMLKKSLALAEKLKDSNQPYFQDTYAWILVQQGKVREGLALLNKIVVASPEVAVFRYHLGVAHYKNADNGAALADLNYALELGLKAGNFPELAAAAQLLNEIMTKTRGH
jgi:lipopolysaccharide biosynthesis regulator YciM